ncbi:MAG: UDP-N-acetylmuramoyl-L-alanyl-D-glutamate--2,6-diaminopimelate ligase [Elusimicrobiales bacterium]|nr:UDP-N-acetylmuramoyl-L-alanyl-D-glutamate--2,6-diaminopimelate ligase [Elusimicrobiales bacterium]
MKLSLLFPTGPAGADPEISAIVNDSRLAAPGALFFAMPGSKTSGENFIRQALEKGAAAVVCAAQPPAAMRGAFPKAVFLTAGDLQRALSGAAAVFYGRPSEKLKVYGLTGTKGKTTTAYVLEAILSRAGALPGVVGTIDYRVGGRVLAQAANTTPFAHTLQQLLASMAEAGAKAAILEVSSHALALGRAEDVAFDVAAFTNLQSDHLDFHGDREKYFGAKARLFELLERSPKPAKAAVLNADDERAPELLGRIGGRLPVLTFGFGPGADFMARQVRLEGGAASFTLQARGRELPVRINLLGRHNVYNALAAIACAAAGGVPLETAAEAAGDLKNVPGRLERVDLGQDYTVFVDYAHTAAALENVLGNLRLLPHGRLITVFGCGGDRDRTKRGPMGRAACALSDAAIITSDNPRSEDPAQIFADIEAGIKKDFSNYELLPDRKEAITRAVGLARKGDIVLIAGKGHETYQILKDRTIHFSDAETAAEAIKGKR